MNDYQQQQWNALQTALDALARLSADELEALRVDAAEYLQFRQTVDGFLKEHFSGRCTISCYQNRRSACCSKDGIITFWADVVINALCSSADDLSDLRKALAEPLYDYKCTYLGRQGCRWRIRPLVCAMFLCDEVQATVFADGNSACQDRWLAFIDKAKGFRWPDQPVLFDRLEIYFIERGYRSPLMYINTSPGLMRIKREAGLSNAKPPPRRTP